MKTARPRIRERLRSLVWRAFTGYGRIKYRHLLPIYRMFGLMNDRGQAAKLPGSSGTLRHADRFTNWLGHTDATSQLESVIKRAESAKGTVVFLPSVGWQIVNTQRCHHLARAFAQKGYVVVFDCSNTYDDVNGWREIEPNLFLFRGDLASLNSLPSLILWTLAYNVGDGERITQPSLRVYDWIDDLAVFPYDRDFLESGHRRAMAQSEIILCVARPLHEQALAMRPDAHYLPNGVNCEPFLQPAELPSDPQINTLLGSGRPIAGYIGALAEWFDYELLDEVARHRSDWDFLLIGPTLDLSINQRGQPLLQRENVHFIGPRPFASMPAYLQLFDVATIPFVINDITLATSPLKLYEYFAAGKPVVTTPMPECEAFAEVNIATNATAFAGALDTARERGRDPAFVERLRQLAQENSWAARVESFERFCTQAASAASSPTD